MKLIAFDTETYPIVQRGKATHLIAPKMVCLTWYDGDRRGIATGLEACERFVGWLKDDTVHLLAHNCKFDTTVMVRACEDRGIDVTPLFFEAKRQWRFHDTGINEALLQIATGGLRGKLALADLAKKYLRAGVGGKEGLTGWRLRYNELDDVTVDKWPKAAVDYAVEDSVYARDVWFAQRRQGNEPFQTRVSLILGLVAHWGIAVDPVWTQTIDAHYDAEIDKLQGVLESEGIIVDGVLKEHKKREVFERAWASLGMEPVRTPQGAIATNTVARDELEALGVEEPLFRTLADYTRFGKYRSTWLEPLLDAGHGPISPNWNPLVNSGRVSCRAPNVLNFPSRPNRRDADVLAAFSEVDDDTRVLVHGAIVGPDIRGCFVPRPGYVFIGADYKAMEMATLAQVIANWAGKVTELGRAINEDRDLHCVVAAQLLGVTYEECVRLVAEGDKEAKRARSVSKIANFAFPVGASAETFRIQARGFGVDVSVSEADVIRRAWFDAWPDMKFFEAKVGEFAVGTLDVEYVVEQHGPNRATRGWRRRRCEKKTEAANSMFQGLGADGSKAALIRIAEACYNTPDSPLYGARPVLYIYDEFVLEVPDDGRDLEAAGAELERLMIEGMRLFTPDIKASAEAEIMRKRWHK